MRPHILGLIARRPNIFTTQATFRRPNSTQQSPSSPHSAFWKTWGRSLSKVVLVAFLTYQMAYLGWFRLEFLERRVEKEAEIKKLEEEVKLLQQQPGPRPQKNDKSS